MNKPTMNQIPPNYAPLMTKVIRVPMRHTFTVEQKMILLRFFENGMIGQSMAYHDKIIQCAQESGLDFEVVKNWVGNQRRKRRMEEMQSVCVGQEHSMNPISPQGSSKQPRMNNGPTGTYSPQRQSQVLYFPRSSDAPVNLQGKPVSTSTSYIEPPSHLKLKETEGGSGMPYSPAFTQAQIVETTSHRTLPHQQSGSGLTQHEHIASPQVPMSPLPSQIPLQREFQTPRSVVVGNATYTSPSSSNVIVNQKNRFPVHQSPPAASCTPVSAVSTNELASCTPSNSDGNSVGHHQFSQSLPGPAGPSLPQTGHVSQDGRYYFSDAPSRRIVPRYLHAADNTDQMSEGSTTVLLEESDSDNEWREIQIQKIMETIQVYVDQLSKLGCEAFLASVSKDTFATYLCGTPLGNNFFTRVNKDLSLSEFVERQLSNPQGTAEDKKLDGVQFDVSSPEEDRNATSDPKSTEEEEEKEEEEHSHLKLNGGDNGEVREGVIRAGEEVFIVNKSHFIIGKGTLLPAPYEKVDLKILPKEEDEGDDHGFIEDKFS